MNQYDGEQSDTTTHRMSVEAGVVEEKSCVPVKQEPGMFHFNHGMMEDDGTTTLLRRKPSRWSRRSSRKTKADKASSETDKQTENTDSDKTLKCDTPSETLTYEPPVVLEPGKPTVIHFSISEEADDHGLLQEQKSEIEVTEKKKGRETRGQNNSEQMKIAKRNTLKLYRKAIDRAFRRGWETFVTSLYSVSLTPVTSTPASSSSGKAGKNGGSVLLAYR